tara:strand:+ start:6528 stop:8522 length:1995 start_codon:yes stop_codon:yes gene_type:complete
MAYKFQEGAANLDGEVSGSSFRTAGSLSGSGDLAVTGNMHAAIFYGSGAGITGISSDAVDVTASSADLAYPIVFTQGAQADGSLGLGLNTALNYNPNDALLSSSAGVRFAGASTFSNALSVTGAISGNVDVYAGDGGNGGFITRAGILLGWDGAMGSTLQYIAGASFLSGSGTSHFVGGFETSNNLDASGSIYAGGNISGSSELNIVNVATFGNDIAVSGAADVVGLASLDGGIDVNGSNFTAGTDGAVTMTSLSVQTGDIGTFANISGSGTAVFASSISSSGDLAVTGNVHAAEFYGGGAGITGISSDAVDVTSSTADIAYPIVFTQGAQSDGSLGLGLNTALNYNPNDAVLSSSAGVQFVGASIFGNTLHASGTVSGAVALQGASVAVDGAVAGLKFTTDDVTYGDSGITMDSDGGHFTIEQDDADKSVRVVLGAAGAKTSGFQIRNSSNSPLWGVTDDGHVSGSGILEVVGASTFVGAVKMSGTVRMETGNSLSFNGSSNTAKITNNGSNLDVNSPGPIILNAATFVSSGVGAQFVGASIFGGALNVTGALTASSLESHGAYNHGSQQYGIATVTSTGALTVASKSYQIVSGGTTAITVTLPAASAGQYYQYGIKRHSLMSGNVILEGDGAELIDGETNITLSTVNASVYLISDGTQWNIF